MELTAAITILGSVIVPFIIAAITRPTWTSDQKRNVTIIVSIVAGVVVALASGKIVGLPDSVAVWTSHIIVSLGAVAALAQGFYLMLKTPVKALEAKTSPTETERTTGN